MKLKLFSALLGITLGIILTILFFVAPPSFLTVAPATIWWVALVINVYADAQENMKSRA